MLATRNPDLDLKRRTALFILFGRLKRVKLHDLDYNKLDCYLSGYLAIKNPDERLVEETIYVEVW